MMFNKHIDKKETVPIKKNSNFFQKHSFSIIFLFTTIIGKFKICIVLTNF